MQFAFGAVTVTVAPAAASIDLSAIDIAHPSTLPVTLVDVMVTVAAAAAVAEDPVAKDPPAIADATAVSV